MIIHEFLATGGEGFLLILSLAAIWSSTDSQEEDDNVLMGNRPFYSMCPLPVLAGLPNPARVQLLPDT